MKKIVSFLKKVKAVFKSIDWSKIETATYVRYIMMIILIINTILTRSGLNPISVSETSVYETVSDLTTAIIFIINTWKNNSVTPAAIEADNILRTSQNLETNADEEADSVG